MATFFLSDQGRYESASAGPRHWPMKRTSPRPRLAFPAHLVIYLLVARCLYPDDDSDE